MEADGKYSIHMLLDVRNEFTEISNKKRKAVAD